MPTQNHILFASLIISNAMMLLLGTLIIRLKNKQQLHYAFVSVIGAISFWSLIRLLQYVLYEFFGVYYTFLEHLHYVGVCLVPVTLLLTGLIFSRTRINFDWRYKLLLVIPALSVMIALTNDFHHLFIVEYSFISTNFVYGPYYFIHEFYSYGCILLGLFHLVYFSVKNSGFFSKQSLLIVLGVIFPLAVVVVSTQKIVAMPVFIENISFSFAIAFFTTAIIKFEFLNITPIALQRVVDLISDGYVIVNKEMEILDYNKAFVATFGDRLPVSRRAALADVLSNSAKINIDAELIMRKAAQAARLGRGESFELHVRSEDFDKHFEIEATPIYSNSDRIGMVILFKDISEYKRNIEIIKRNQEIILEQERMASLGQMIGGIAHNLKTPIMSIAGGIEALRDLTEEYRRSVGDDEVTPEDHLEIAREMNDWLVKMKPYCTYMSDVISAVKGQAVQMIDSSTGSFVLEELVKRVDLLMRHDLKKHHCTLVTDFQADMNTEIKGELNNLVQVFDNIIINAMHSYEGARGEIYFQITRTADKVNFMIRDNGKGIPDDIQKRLFREMVTTKGKDGTGLGLYMSYSTIKGRFGGSLWFTSRVGSGTTFYITIPCKAASEQPGGEKA